MSWDKPNASIIENSGDKIKRELNSQITDLLRNGTQLNDIVELLDAKDFFENIGQGRNQSPVAHFDVDGFIAERASENRNFSLPEKYEKIDEVILPPSKSGARFGGESEFKEANIIPRATMLMEILADLNLKYSVMEGKNNPNMMRKLSYLAFYISSIKKLVLVNDEERNATFIVHKTEDEKWKEYLKMTKDELSEISGDIISSINYSDKRSDNQEEIWKKRVKKILIDGPDEIKIPGEIEKIPEGWKVLGLSMKILNASRPIMQKYIEEYEKTNPEWIKRNGLNGVYLSPELIDLIKKQREESVVPDGWLSPFALAKKLDSTLQSIMKRCEEYRKTNPDWFKFYTNIQGKNIEHYSPELIKAISERSGEVVFAPEGWITRNALSKTIRMSELTMKKIAEDYRITNPEYFKNFKAKVGVPTEYYSPDLKKIFIDKYGIKDTPKKEHFSHELAKKQLEKNGKINEAPIGWLTAGSLKKLINIGREGITEFVGKYRNNHPEWFGIYKNRSGMVTEHFHPELVEIIKKEFNESKPLSGWLNRHALSEIINVDQETVRKYAENYKKSNPGWFKEYKDTRGIFREYYSPELVKILEEKLQELSKSYEKAPEGWKTKTSFRKTLGTDWYIFEEILNDYKTSNPDWFRMYKDERGMAREHLSPQLMDVIKEKREKELAPDGWKTAFPLAESFGISIQTLQGYAEEYRTQHPEWFGNYHHEKNRRYMEYYSPDLVKVLELKIKLKRGVN